MNYWFLAQIVFNIIVVAGIGVLITRHLRPPKEDPRLSKGLQLLQSKIAILEDLSDRTETQVQQLTALLENKCIEIQTKIQNADKQMNKIDLSVQKSMEVAKIFQDKIPHEEIMERQNTVRYVKAARMANQGLSIEQICQEVNISRAEVEFIAKVNRDQLMFCEESLPEWVAEDLSFKESNLKEQEQEHMQSQVRITMPVKDNYKEVVTQKTMQNAFETPKVENDALKKLGEEFKKACMEAELQKQMHEEMTMAKTVPTQSQQVMPKQVESAPAPFFTSNKSNNGKKEIRPVVFPRIDNHKNTYRI